MDSKNRSHTLEDLLTEYADESGPMGLGERIVSEAQRHANKRNARKSTGPRTISGKARAAKNAMLHGLYSTQASAIPRGSLKENARDVQDFIGTRVEALEPRDAMEFGVAVEIARTMLKLARLDVYTAQLMCSDGKLSPEDMAAVAPTMDVAAFRLIGNTAEALSTHLFGAEGEVIWHQFEAWAKLIRYHRKGADLDVKDLWTAELTPTTEDEWKRAFDALLRHCFKDKQEAMLWATDIAGVMDAKARYAQGRTYEVAAAKALNGTFETTNKHRARILRELEQLLSMYSTLQERFLG